MQRTWTTKQVAVFLMALLSAVELTRQIKHATQLTRDVEENHLQAFKESLEPGFFAQDDAFHVNLMHLSDESFLALTAVVTHLEATPETGSAVNTMGELSKHPRPILRFQNPRPQNL